MTTTLVAHETPAAHTRDAVAGASAVVLARALLAEHGRLGVILAGLDHDDVARWTALRPTLARLSRDGRATAGELAARRGRALPEGVGQPLAATEAVPPVVWARELGAVQRLLRRALADLELDGDADARCAPPLRRALRGTSTATAVLAAATGADV